MRLIFKIYCKLPNHTVHNILKAKIYIFISMLNYKIKDNIQTYNGCIRYEVSPMISVI